MPHYMIQAAYTPETWAGLAKQPQDRSRAIRPMVKNLKGRLVSYYNSFGDYDVVVIVELPDNEAAAAIAIRSFSLSGSWPGKSSKCCGRI